MDGLTLHDLHPPAEVVGSFHDVARAMEQADRIVNEARAEQLRKLAAAHADALSTTRQAEARASQIVEDARARRETILGWLRLRQQLPTHEDARLLAGLIADGSDPSGWLGGWAGESLRRQQSQQAHREQIDFRLTWAALAAALAGRDKIIIDADRVPGRRQLLMFDPEWLRPPRKE